MHISLSKEDCLDKNNFAPSVLRSLGEIRGDCFELRYFSEEADLPERILRYQIGAISDISACNSSVFFHQT